MNKKCSKCGEAKELNLFHNNKASKDGKYPQCKECRKKLPTYTRNNRKSSLKRKYGLTIADKEAMIKKQASKCSICSKPINLSSCVDHCHKTGNIREILCQPCNKMLGYARDNTEILKSAIKYLDKHRQNC